MKKKGSAFILAIVTIALLAVVAVSVVKVTTSTTVTNSSFDETYNLKLTAQSGVMKAFNQLKVDYDKFEVSNNKKGSEVSFPNLDFTTGDGKLDCKITVYNYDINNPSDKTKYTIESIAATKDKKHTKKVVANCNKIVDKVNNKTTMDFFEVLTNNAISLINDAANEAVIVNGAQKHTFLTVAEDTPSYIQGRITNHITVSSNVTENLTGKIIIPQITSSKAKKQNGSDINLGTWAKLGDTAPYNNIFVYKVTSDETLASIMSKATTAITGDSSFFTSTKLKVILISGKLHVNVGRGHGNTIDPELFKNCIVLSTDEIYTDKNKCAVSFEKSSVCATAAHDKNKTRYYFDDKVVMDAATKDVIKQFIVDNTTYTSNPAQTSDVLTNRPSNDLTYVE